MTPPRHVTAAIAQLRRKDEEAGLALLRRAEALETEAAIIRAGIAKPRQPENDNGKKK